MRTNAALSPLVREALVRLRAGVVARLGGGRLARLVLFGSYARGQAREDSDVDVLVVLNEGGARGREIVSEVAASLYPELGLLVNPVVFDVPEYERVLCWTRVILGSRSRGATSPHSTPCARCCIARGSTPRAIAVCMRSFTRTTCGRRSS